MLQGTHVLFLAVGAVISFIWILFLRFSSRAQVFRDVPNSRSSHAKTTPRGAGFAFAVAIFATTIISESHYVLGLASLAISTLGLCDDIFSISAKKRFIIQLGISTFTLLLEMNESIISNPTLIFVFGIMLLVMLSAINFYNFADGINGHIAIQASVALGAWVIFAKGPDTWLPLLGEPVVYSLLGSLLVFIWANLVKGFVFMGDAGSTFLGFLVIAFPLVLLGKLNGDGQDWMLYLAANLVFSFVIFADCTCLILAKFLSKIPYSMPHRHHFYQQLARRKNWSHAKVSLALGVLQLAISISFIAGLKADFVWFYVFAIMITSYTVCLYFNSISAMKSLKEIKASLDH